MRAPTPAGLTPLALWSRFGARTLVAPYYHVVSDQQLPHIHHLYRYRTVARFRHDLDVLLSVCVPVGLGEVITAVREGRPLPRGALHVSFDDGLREVSDVVAPILYQKGVPATFFVNSRFVDNAAMCYQHQASLIADHLQQPTVTGGELAAARRLLGAAGGAAAEQPVSLAQAILGLGYRQRRTVQRIAQVLQVDVAGYLRRDEPYLTGSQISGLIEKGFTIGAHSIDHPLYRDLPLEEQLRQTCGSLQAVRDRFGLDYGAFAFPHSDRGVSRRFFAELGVSGLADVCFGTSEMRHDVVPWNIQRFSMEKSRAAPRRILARQHLRLALRRLAHRNEIRRPDGTPLQAVVDRATAARAVAALHAAPTRRDTW